MSEEAVESTMGNDDQVAILLGFVRDLQSLQIKQAEQTATEMQRLREEVGSAKAAGKVAQEECARQHDMIRGKNGDNGLTSRIVELERQLKIAVAVLKWLAGILAVVVARMVWEFLGIGLGGP